MMAQIFDLTEDALKRLKRLIPDATIQAATEAALATPARKCRAYPACVHRLTLTDDQRLGIVQRLRTMLARDGYEDDSSTMLPIGHIYEGLIQTFSRESRVVV